MNYEELLIKIVKHFNSIIAASKFIKCNSSHLNEWIKKETEMSDATKAKLEDAAIRLGWL